MNLSNFHRNVPLSFYKKSVKSIYLPSYPTRTKEQYYCFHEIFSEFYFTVCKCTHHSVRVKMKNLLSPKDLVISLAKLLLHEFSANKCNFQNVHYNIHTVWKLRKIILTLFPQKFREINNFL